MLRPCLAAEVNAASASASSRSVSRSACLTFGTSRPRGVAAAIPRWTACFTTMSPASPSQVALICGCRRTARSNDFATSSSGETFTPRKSGSDRNRSTSFIERDTSTCTHSVTCGAVKALATTAAAVARRTPRTGIRVSPACRDGAWDGASDGRPVGGLLDVRPGDDAAGTSRRDLAEVDAEDAGQSADRRLGQRPPRDDDQLRRRRQRGRSWPLGRSGGGSPAGRRSPGPWPVPDQYRGAFGHRGMARGVAREATRELPRRRRVDGDDRGADGDGVPLGDEKFA